MKYLYKEERPWGRFFVISDEEKYKIKKIEVEPNQRLSYQFHNKRSEYWIIIKGNGLLVLNDIKSRVKVGDTVFIEKTDRHRIQNAGDKMLVFIEVQTGSYFGEDDIVRIEDDFNRVK